MANNEIYEKVKNTFIKNHTEKVERLKIKKEQLLEAQNNKDNRKIEFYSKRITTLLQDISSLESIISCMRPNTDLDIAKRNDILNNYSQKVDEAIPDDVPLVFHGNKNINTVIEIIESGGLFTPEERNVDFKSFATQIDVTAKTNIRVSLEFADAGICSFMPYGAIFVFYPKLDEYDNVLKTKDSSEVSGGVRSISFKKEPERLFGIITTEENIEKIKTACKRNGIDASKVLTHEQFIEYSKNILKVQERDHRMSGI